jgi:hypothetical protein
MNNSRTIVASYKCRKSLNKKKQRGRKTIIPSFNTDLTTKLQVDIDPMDPKYPEWMKNLRVVRAFTLPEKSSLSLPEIATRGFRGYKIVSQSLQSFNGYQFEVGKFYRPGKNDGPIQLCRSGFHYSPDPLQCLYYADMAGMKKPWRLLVVRGSGDSRIGRDKLCSENLYVESEIKDPNEKKRLLTGIHVSPDNIIQCYKDGQFNDPAPDVYAEYDKGKQVYYTSFKNGKHLANDTLISLPGTSEWPPAAFRSLVNKVPFL